MAAEVRSVSHNGGVADCYAAIIPPLLDPDIMPVTVVSRYGIQETRISHTHTKGIVMITVGMDYKIVPGKDDEFISVFKKVIGIMADMPGHAKTHLYRDIDEEHDYLIVSEWTDEAAFNSFMGSDRFKNVATWGKENVLRTRPKHEIYGGTAPSGGCPASAG